MVRLKPLLSAPLTDEDIDIWVTVMHGVGAPLAEVGPLLRPFFAADRRDAERMLELECGRQNTVPNGYAVAHRLLAMTQRGVYLMGPPT